MSRNWQGDIDAFPLFQAQIFTGNGCVNKYSTFGLNGIIIIRSCNVFGKQFTGPVTFLHRYFNRAYNCFALLIHKAIRLKRYLIPFSASRLFEVAGLMR